MFDEVIAGLAALMRLSLDNDPLFKTYFNESRVHLAINGKTPVQQAQATEPKLLDLREYIWKSHCNGLFELPNAA